MSVEMVWCQVCCTKMHNQSQWQCHTWGHQLSWIASGCKGDAREIRRQPVSQLCFCCWAGCEAFCSTSVCMPNLAASLPTANKRILSTIKPLRTSLISLSSGKGGPGNVKRSIFNIVSKGETSRAHARNIHAISGKLHLSGSRYVTLNWSVGCTVP